ncbi:MAG: hypothetical protein ACHQ4F_03685 [Candidatus Dormibacteria bacterium]
MKQTIVVRRAPGTPTRASVIHRFIGPLVLVPGLALAACSASANLPTVSAKNAVNGGTSGGGAITFAVHVSFTGADSVQGSFTDNSSGTGYSSCADFAKGDSVGFVQGPGTPSASNTVIDGKSVSFLLHVAKDAFHGPGTYSGNVIVGGGPTIGSDSFFSTASSSYTINGDGSGQASFTNATGTATQSESGTVTWTCSS